MPSRVLLDTHWYLPVITCKKYLQAASFPMSPSPPALCPGLSEFYSSNRFLYCDRQEEPETLKAFTQTERFLKTVCKSSPPSWPKTQACADWKGEVSQQAWNALARRLPWCLTGIRRRFLRLALHYHRQLLLPTDCAPTGTWWARDRRDPLK